MYGSARSILHGLVSFGLLAGASTSAKAQLSLRNVDIPKPSVEPGLFPGASKAEASTTPALVDLPSNRSIQAKEDSIHPPISSDKTSRPSLGSRVQSSESSELWVASTNPVAPSPVSGNPTPSPSLPVSPSAKQLRDSLRIQPIVKFEDPWPSPSLSPGVPSAFVASWGDVFAGISGATAGKQRPDVDGSFNVGFGLGDSAKLVGLELSGGCGSFKQFCGNGSFTARVGRLLINKSTSRLSLAGAWQNFAQWGNEGRQDNIYYGAVSYAFPLRPPGSGFGQTLQLNAGIGNSSYAPFTETNSESAIGGFGSIGIELSPAVGLSAGWSGRGANAQLSYTPFRSTPLTLNVLGSDLFNQTPAGAVAVFSLSWGKNFATPNFN